MIENTNLSNDFISIEELEPKTAPSAVWVDPVWCLQDHIDDQVIELFESRPTPRNGIDVIDIDNQE